MAMARPHNILTFTRNCLLVRPNCTGRLEDEFTQNYSQDAFRQQGIRDSTAFRRFLEAHPYLFVLNQHKGEVFVSLTTTLTVCPAHSRKSGSCKEGSCESLHICVSHLLSGKCSHGPHCRFGHNPETQQNSRVLKAHSLDDLNVDELRLIFKLPFVRRGATRPEVCHSYNKGSCDFGGREGKQCRHLHICRHYVKNDCRHGKHCRLNHNINDQVKGVLALYGVSCDRKPREILEDLLMYMENEDTYDQKRSHLKWLGSDLSGAREVTGRIPQKGQICEFFLKGRCKYGAECEKVHDRHGSYAMLKRQ